MSKYNPAEIEKKWQSIWQNQETFKATEDPSKKKFYALVEFPYPSGAGLHVGHIRPFTAMDVIARKRRMQGENVLYPMGFDAFGLPTENFAIKTGRPPAEVTAENIATFTRQLKAAGFSFDWSRVVDTTDPEYYRWTQWIFLQLFKHGLAYKKNQPINWCPKDKIGLANEEVVNGCCERCGTAVEKRNKEQWMLRITAYADSLLKGLKEVDYIPQAKTQQENWIGKSEGAKVLFTLKVSGQPDGKQGVSVFTTRPDTIFGVTFLAVSPELASSWIKAGWQTSDEVKKYITEVLASRTVAATREEQEKTGVNAGIKAVNPVTKEEIPVWITNYVLGEVGTGAIMGVPAHDERDFDFAKKFGLPIKEVIEPLFKKTDGVDAVRTDAPFKERQAAVAIVKHWAEDKYLCFKWKKTDWRGFVIGGIEPGEHAIATAQREIVEETGYTSAKFVRKLGGVVHAQFYQMVKNENRFAHFQGLLFELTDGNRIETTQEEKDIQDLHWVSKNEVEQFLSWVKDMRLLWNRVLKEESYGGEGILANSGEFTGLSTEEARKKVVAWLETNRVGAYEVQFKLRDWVFSRQRYWGEPIPLVYCAACADRVKKTAAEKLPPAQHIQNSAFPIQDAEYSWGEILNPGWFPLAEDQLPLKLPEIKKYEPTDTGESPLSTLESWVQTTCPKCGGAAKRETDTMPNWAGSSWYFLRYLDPKNNQALASPEAMQYWLGSPKSGVGGVDWYNGGMEHTVLHLLYSRFWNQFLCDIGVVPTREPYQKRTSHGLILAKGGEKMSKSKGNVVSPDEVIEQYGADTLRTYVMFMGPFDQPVEWDTNGLIGVRRFLDRVWGLQDKVTRDAEKNEVISLMHRAIKKISEDIEEMHFNTAIAALMELVNDLTKQEKIGEFVYQDLLKLLAPFAPHITEELWGVVGDGKALAYAVWPVYDLNLAKVSELTIAIQINGKVRDTITVPAETAEEEIKKLVLVNEKVQKWLEGKEPKKVIYVKGKLVSVVV
jgi:leucyl-tRNA synthetase